MQLRYFLPPATRQKENSRMDHAQARGSVAPMEYRNADSPEDRKSPPDKQRDRAAFARLGRARVQCGACVRQRGDVEGCRL